MAKRRGTQSLEEISIEREKEEAWKKFRQDHPFYKILPGINTLRIISKPISYFIHWMDSSETGKLTRNICTNDDKCKYCKLAALSPGDRRKAKSARYGFWIIDRERDDSIKMFETGRMVFSGIGKIFEKNNNVDLSTYDIVIKRVGEGIETRYTVTEPILKLKKLDEQIVEDAQIQVSDIPIDLVIANNGKDQFLDDLMEEKRVLNRNW